MWRDAAGERLLIKASAFVLWFASHLVSRRDRIAELK
jgi:hypothetical protein